MNSTTEQEQIAAYCRRRDEQGPLWEDHGPVFDNTDFAHGRGSATYVFPILKEAITHG